MITVLADQHLFEVDVIVPDSIQLKHYNPNRDLLPQIAGADALLIRTVTKLPAKTVDRLPDSISFIGTASAGTDHVAVDQLAERGITFSSSAGCNAQSVAEYVTTALLIWAEANYLDYKKLNAGIVGAGNTGSALHKLLRKLNISTVSYDPPRAWRENDFSSTSLKEVLDADVLSFHTPLTKNGKYPTYHWLDEQKLYNRRFELVINASRGGVVDEQALLNAHKNGQIKDFITDVWENEPFFSDQTARQSFIFTPHIAGYSIQAKRRATELVVDALCTHFSIPRSNDIFQSNSKNISATQFDHPDTTLCDILKTIHPIKDYQKQLESLIGKSANSKKVGFNNLRTNFPMRHEYGYLKTDASLLKRFPTLQQLGMQASSL